MSLSNYRAAVLFGAVGLFSAALANTAQTAPGQGVYSVVTTGIPSAIGFSEITGSIALMPILYGVGVTA